MLKRLFAKDWDLAILQFKSRAPMLLEHSVCTVEEADGFVVIEQENAEHPIDKTKTCKTTHYIPTTDITGITYSVENKKKKSPLAKVEG